MIRLPASDLRIVPIATLIVLLLSACSGSVAQAPPASALPSASPSVAATADQSVQAESVLESFMAVVHGPELSMEVDHGGSITGDGVDFAIEGSLRDAGEREHHTGTTTIGGVADTHETTRIGDVAYVRYGEGPWFVDRSGAVTAYAFQLLFDGIQRMDFQDVRMEPERRWEFGVPSMDMDQGLFQFDIPTADDLVITTTRFDVEVRDDGMPMSVEIDADMTFTLDGSAHAATMEYWWTFREVGERLAVVEPDSALDIYTDDDFGFSIGLPYGGDWSLETSDGMPIVSSGRGYVTVRIGGWSGTNLEADLPSLDELMEMTAVAREPISIAEVDGFLSTYEAVTDGGLEFTVWMAVIPKGQVLWMIEMGSPSAIAASLRPLYDDVLSTFSTDG